MRSGEPMKQVLIPTAGLVCGLLVAGAGRAQNTGPVRDAAPQAVVRTLPALTSPEGRGVKLNLAGTQRLPGALGEARVERKRGQTEISVKLKDLKPALLFGGDYNTYVLWTVSPEGLVYNAGEFVLQGSSSELNTSTPLITFGMLVTAEPHFLVEAPSPLAVLETKPEGQGLRIQYQEFDRGYNLVRQTLANEEPTKGEFRVDREQAMTAVALAERAGAERHAPQEFAQAREALRTTIEALGKGDPEQMTPLAHRTVRLAVEAQRLAGERARQSAIDTELRDLRSRVAELETNLRKTEQARREFSLAAERHRDEAEDLRRQLREARSQLQQAQSETRRLSWLQSEAETAADRARRESEELRARMHDALSRVAETRDTARGLVVNLPDILFDSGKATLRMQAKEVLSRVTGILLVTPGYRLSVEGHTDSVGSPRLNQELSDKRAQAVHDYLAEAGFATEAMTTKGYGESQPIASNDTNTGRQQNRRVEIIIQDVTGAGISLQPAAPADPNELANPR